QTDKMVAELPSPTTGKIREIVVPLGETVQVGTTLLYIEAEGSKDIPQKNTPSTPTQHEEKPHQEKTEPTRQHRKFSRVLATPYTRKVARDHDIDIEQVQATDPSGRVTEEDVYRFIKGEQSPKVEQ